MIKIKKILIVIFMFLVTTVNLYAKIEDALFLTVGNKAITKSDIVDEIKIILILNNMSYSDEKRDELQQMAIKSTIKKNVKEIEIEKFETLEFSKEDLNNELIRLANRIDMDVDTLKNICESNGLDFAIIENQIKIELLWNSFIFNRYRNKLTVNSSVIEDKLDLNKNKKKFDEYLISELIIEKVPDENVDAKIKEVKNIIDIEGFESAAMNLSISQTAIKGGDMGWVKENEISEMFRSKIISTNIGELSEPILLKEGILIFKVRDKRTLENDIDIDELKNQIIANEKTKILNMYSMSHYDNLRRAVSIKFFNE